MATRNWLMRIFHMYSIHCILWLQVLLTNADEQTQCMHDMDVQQMLQQKDDEIVNLHQQIEELQQRLNQNQFADEDDSVITCNSVPMEMHLRNPKQCIHECSQPHSCSNKIMSCFPYDNCQVRCSGHSSCQHSQIDAIIGPTALSCTGLNSCIDLVFNAIEDYPVDDDISNLLYAEKYEPSIDTFEWYLPRLMIGNHDEDEFMQFTQQNVIMSPHFMVAKHVLSRHPGILEKVNESQQRCGSLHDSEHRDFGAGVYEVVGHDVTFMDDCVDEEVYRFCKNVTLGLLRYLQKNITQSLQEQQIDSEDTQSIMDYVASHWLYDWQEFLSLSNDLETRVIEHIHYKAEGNLGWHRDDDSNLTLVTMLNDPQQFEGGTLRFRLNYWDENVYAIRLEKDDMILFPSIADHAVDPVTGARHVMVFEWWNLGRSYEPNRTGPFEQIQRMQQQQE